MDAAAETRPESKLTANFPNFIFVEIAQRLDDSALLDEFLNAGNTIVVCLDQIRLRCPARLDRIGVNRALTEYPVAFEEMPGAQDPVLHLHELRAR